MTTVFESGIENHILLGVGGQGPPGPVGLIGQSYAIITSFAGNAIPAGTAWTDCTVSPDFYLAAGGSGTYTAEGVEGTLRRVGNQYQFSRTVAGSATPIAPNVSVFLPGPGKGLPITVDTVDSLKAQAPPAVDGLFRMPLGWEAIGDSQPATYRWSAGSFDNTPQAIRPNSVAAGSPGRWENRLALSANYFGILADIPSNNTAAITRNTARFQAAVEYCMTKPCCLELPHGIIRVNDSIKLNQQSGGSTFRGVSMRGTIIEQVTNNKPCFDITANLFNAFEISNLQFQWAQNQPASNKDAIAIRFSGQDSCWAGIFTKLLFNNGYRGIESGSVSPSALGGGSMWGNEYSHIWSTGMSGSAIALLSQVGSPQNDLRNIYVLGGAASEPFIAINAGLETTISAIELNQNPNSQTFISLVGGTYADIKGVRTETNTTPNTTGAHPVIKLSNSFAAIGQIELQQTIAVGAGNSYRLFDGDSGSKISIQSLVHGLAINSGNVHFFDGGMDVYCLDITDVAYDQHGGNRIVSNNIFAFTNLSSEIANKAYLHQQNRRRTIDRGDGDITLTEWDEFDHQKFTNALTATRTVTFPSSFSENCQVGRRFKVSKMINTVIAPTSVGDLRCIGVDGGAFVIPAATRGWVEFEYYRFGWKMSGSGEYL